MKVLSIFNDHIVKYCFGRRGYKQITFLERIPQESWSKKFSSNSSYKTQDFLFEGSDPFNIHSKQSKENKAHREKESLKERVKDTNQINRDWELTIGMEIHALLNTERKLFSPALSTVNQRANTHVAPFDLMIPGSQPIFQKEAIIPAIRAALILNCDVQTTSKFDRKHYHHWDQPAGYQITQYYQPYAIDGYVTLFTHDGIAKEDGDQIRIRIKQIQLEQDTAKTISRPEGHLLDFNRVGLPLIEIVTHPEIHYPKTAAALVRKIQALIGSVNACVVGMECGGLRADVNVSVRRYDKTEISCKYENEKLLGQKIELKNLSSFKSIEDAILAERERQIRILEEGLHVTAETRGWAIGDIMTKKLREKEEEVDYRYMPDPDLSPLIICDDVISYLKSTLGKSYDEEIAILIHKYGITAKDAMTLVHLENGGRVEYFYKVVESLMSQLPNEDSRKLGKLSGDWVLHDIGSLKYYDTSENCSLQIDEDGTCIIPSEEVATLLFLVETKKILRKPAKYILRKLFTNAVQKKSACVHEIIEKEDLWNRKIPEGQYREQAQILISQHGAILKAILAGNESKYKAIIGMILKNDVKGNMDPKMAEQAVRQVVDEYRRESVRIFKNEK